MKSMRRAGGIPMGWMKRTVTRVRTWKDRARSKSTPKSSDVYTGKPEGSNAPFDQFGSGGSAFQEGRRR